MRTALLLAAVVVVVVVALDDRPARSKSYTLREPTIGWGAAGRRVSADSLPARVKPARERPEWAAYRAAFGKRYRNASDEELHARILEETEAIIAEHNAAFTRGETSFEMGLNEFADMTEDEYRARTPDMDVAEFFRTTTGASVFNAYAYVGHANDSHVRSKRAPSEFDWREHSCVQKVQNQGACGSCYTFSAMGAVETAICAKERETLLDLSEQQLVDCAGRGCSGGWMHNMFSYLKNTGGAMKEIEYPYTGSVGTCDSQKLKVARVKGFAMISSESDLEAAIANVGAVSVAYNAGTQAFARYQGGIFDMDNCGNNPTHAVLVVGYGTENGKEYWIVKNSWGTVWGENGYFRIAKGKNMCGIADWASYPIV